MNLLATQLQCINLPIQLFSPCISSRPNSLSLTPSLLMFSNVRISDSPMNTDKRRDDGQQCGHMEYLIELFCEENKNKKTWKKRDIEHDYNSIIPLYTAHKYNGLCPFPHVRIHTRTALYAF